jgi:hypothetical protein
MTKDDENEVCWKMVYRLQKSLDTITIIATNHEIKFKGNLKIGQV